jgi:hypothetical protein
MLKFVLSFFLVISAFANQAKALSYKGSALDQMIYIETKEVCIKSQNGLRAIFNTNTMNSFLISTGQSLSLLFSGYEKATEEFKTMAQTNMIGIYASDRLNSDGFITAVNECFPNNPKLKTSFVLSMLAADNVGKIPAIYSFIYLTKISTAALARIPKRVAITIKMGFVATALVLAILESRKQLKNRELTDFEKERVNQITSGMKKNVEASGNLVIEIAKEEIDSLEKLYNSAQSQEEKDQIRSHIDNIQNLLKNV